ncbi:hypothetical protein ACN27F_15995 [Solwaraspora sp. WMMB335]|uniref:hypothetical protein n=1 Tax=Solwaraspora sp. WMMB335 TaxID=3404118 RepID=UPI003B9567CC
MSTEAGSATTVGLVELGRLGPQLAEGGQARIHLAPGLTLSGVSEPLVAKLYKDFWPSPYGLRRLVSVRNGLTPDRRNRLDQLAAWPLRVIEHDGQVRGVVLPLIPPTFFQDRVLPGTGRPDRTPREVQHLLIPPARARRVGMPTPSREQRLRICRDFALMLHFVHRHDLIIGDLSARNALFRIGAYPSVMLVDCDAIRIRGNAPVVAQLNTPDWDPPERPLTQYSDRYKFGLFVLRCLSNGDQMSTTRDPARADAVLDPPGRQLLRAALAGAPTDRPSARDWGDYFEFRLTGRRLPPVVVDSGRTVTPRRSETLSTTGWIRDPATGRWKQR